MAGRRGAAAGLVLGGLAVLVGSLMDWGDCPDTSCGNGGGAFFVIVERSGLDWGPGVATLVIGFALALVGVDALRRGGSTPAGAIAFAGAVTTFAIAAQFVSRTSWSLFTRPFVLYGPREGVFLAAFGAVIAAIASIRMRVPNRADGPST